MFMGPCFVSVFQYISNKIQRYTILLYLVTALHVLGCTSTHHQERMQLYLQHLVIATPLCRIPDAVDTGVCAPDDGWKYHPKHLEQFPNIIKLCNVASYRYILEIIESSLQIVDRNSVADITTCFGLDGPGSSLGMRDIFCVFLDCPPGHN
jgi:hypothetical protein